MKNVQHLKVALVYDWVDTPHGGAERVLAALHKVFPHAPLYTSVYNSRKTPWAQSIKIHTSFLQYIPVLRRHHRYLLPLLPLAFRTFDFSSFDLVISVSSAESKGIIISKPTLHICYLLTPPRYLWSHTHEYQRGALQLLKASVFSRLRICDFLQAQRIDAIIPISNIVRQRALKYYRRTIEQVVYPPFLQFPQQVQSVVLPEHFNNYFLIVARLVPYKKVLEAVHASLELSQPLVLVGDGPQASEIRHSIESHPHRSAVLWFRELPDYSIAWLYSHCSAFLLPAEEDFGITALEAQSYGKPVLVYEKSGAAEVVENGRTGIYIHHQSVEGIKKAIIDSKAHQWQSSSIKKHAQLYNEENFSKRFIKTIEKILDQTITTEREV